MEFDVVCPNRRWNANSPAGREGIARMEALGLKLVPDDRPSPVPVWRVATTTKRFESLEELVAFQQAVGAALLLDGTTLEIDAG